MTTPTVKQASVTGKEEGSPPPLTLTASTSAEQEVQPMKSSMVSDDGKQLESNEPAKKRFKITGIRTGKPVITAYTGPTSTANAVSQKSASKGNHYEGVRRGQPDFPVHGSSRERETMKTVDTGVSSDQLLKTVDGSHQPSLNNSGLCNIPGNTTISGLSQLNMLSLTNLEESIDKELKEAQERKHLCETEERNALKAYMEAQRSLIEANARGAELHSKRASLSARYGSLIQEGTRLLWPSVHPAGEVSAPAEKEKDEVSASGSKDLDRFSAGIAGSLTTPGSATPLKQTHPGGWIIEKKQAVSIAASHEQQIALRESELKLKAAQPKKDDAITSRERETMKTVDTGVSSERETMKTVDTGVSSDQLLKTVDGSHQPSLNNSGLCNIPGNTTISGLSQLNMLSLTNLEESIDRELKEAQERKHLCETEERNALKAYMEAQRSLIEANARCAELHSKGASLSARYGSLIQEGTRLLWPSVHPAGEVSAPAEKEKDEVSASGSKYLASGLKKKKTKFSGPVSSASKELVPFAGNVGSEVPRRRIKLFFSAEESKRILETVETLLANDDKFLHSKRRNWKLIRDHCFEDDNQRTSGDVKDKWETLVRAATAGGTKKQRGEKLSEQFLQRILAAETQWKSGQEQQQEQEEKEDEEDEEWWGNEIALPH